MTILTVDLGTSFTKVAVWSADGLVAMGRAPLVTNHPGVGRAEQDPASWWASVVEACPPIDEPVDVIGFAAARKTFVPVTEDGTPLGPGILWSDRRAPDVSGKVAWLADHEPDRLDNSRWLLSPRDLVVRQMTGVVTTDRTLAWLFAIDDRVPAPRPSTDVVGALQEGAANALGIRAGTPVVIGAGDRQCEVLGTAASRTRPMVSWGTTANVSVPVADPDPPDGIVLTRAAIDGWLLEGGVSAAGSLLAWLAKVTGTDGLWDRAATSPPGARGVIALPWLGGARAPWWNDDVGAAWLNLGPAHDAADMARAAIEGVAIELGRCLVRAARDAEGIVLAGGGSASSLWAEILTAVTGLPAQRRRSPEAASAGAALLAAAGVGLELDVDRINPVVEEIVPDPALVEIYGVVRDASDAAAHAVIEL